MKSTNWERLLRIRELRYNSFYINWMKQKKKVVEDKVMIEEDKIILINRLEEKSIELTKISNMQLDSLSQMMNANYELNVKEIEITTLKL